MSPIVKNLLLLLAFILLVGHIDFANATTINFPETVKCMIKHKTNCEIC